MVRGRFNIFIVYILSALCLSATSLPRGQAQATGATVSGTITDLSGAVVANVAIRIKNVGTQISRRSSSDSSGFYSIPNLQPGIYALNATSPGFSEQERTGITLAVGMTQVINVTLKIGSVSQEVVVIDVPPTVQLEDSSVGAVTDSMTIRELPLNGRSWSDLAKLQPGVSAIQSQRAFAGGSGRGTRGYGAQLSISGARPQQNNYRLDGVSLNDYANGGPGSVLGGSLGVDAIQEFSVLTSNYSAEYGKSSGGIINAVTRSGTNEFHGSAYEFFRDGALDARNYFDGPSVPSFVRNQFGGSAGGPILKDRTFIFGDYEGIRQSQGITSVQTVPSAAARSGNLCSNPGGSGTPSCSPTTITVDPGAQTYLALYPLPNGGSLGNGDTGIYNFVGQQVVSENFFTTRLDHHLSDKNSLFGTYLYDKTPFTTPDNLNAVLLGQSTARQALILEENHIFTPTLFNTIRFGFTRVFANTTSGQGAINPAVKDSALSAIPGQQAGELSVGGISSFGGATGGSNYFYRWNTFQTSDDVFLTRGVHSIEFGASVERDQDNETSTNAQGGQWFFGSLPNYLQNIPNRFSGALPGAITGRSLRQTIIGLYVQDNWRLRKTLTLNLGVRYEFATVPTEVHNKLSNLYSLTDPTPHLGTPFFNNPTVRDFAPRVGFSWDPFADNKTVVHGGFGIYDSLPLLYEYVTLNGYAAPFFAVGTIHNSNPPHGPPNGLNGTFPGNAFPLLQNQGSSSLNYVSVQQNPSRNYVMQWDLNVQREITPNLTAFLGYVGTRGIHQPFRVDDANLVLPTLTSAGYVWPKPQGSGTVLNPNVGAIRYLNWKGHSGYNGLLAGITKTMSHGFQLQGSFTWSKSIDTGSGVIAGDTFTNSISSLPWYDLRLSRGVSDFNVPRTLVASGTWQAPPLESLRGPAAWVANGWELGLIYNVSDGTPFTATFGTDGDPLGLNSSDPWDVPNRLKAPGCGTLVNPGHPNNYIKTQCFSLPTAPTQAFYDTYCDPSFAFPTCINLRGNAGRNILTGPGLSELDFSIFKNNPIRAISDTFNIQLRLETFNLLNHANFAPPVTPDHTDIFVSTGEPTGSAGLLTSTSTTSRQVQLAAKIIW